MSKQARTAVKQIAKLLGALGPSFLRTEKQQSDARYPSQKENYGKPRMVQ